MDKQSAIKLIRETFEKSFDKNQFVYFIKNLFNKIEIEAGTFKNGYYGQFIPESFKPHIKMYKRIGKYNDGNNRIDILVVHLEKEKLIERARTMQRNFIAGYLNGKYGSNAVKGAALVAFISPNEEDWRFSLVKMEYKLAQTRTGRPKGEEEWTPAKRFSFLVGKNEPNHTAQSRLYPLLKDDINNPTLTQLEDAFNIETVTKEFFERYRNLFIRIKEAIDNIIHKYPAIKEDFTNKGVETVDFAKKLMGQIVFLYFLQKKGWFGVEKGKDWGTGSKRFLRDLYEGKIIQYKNFFNDVLEPLFYDALARDRSDIDHYNEHFKTKIPFLNGGLFDPINNYDWVNTDILLPDELFSNNKKTKQGDIGDGILDVFDRYNFTVREDEPLEKEVAIDPEMLGKVFENLLAVKDRKSKGTYYTPREIVHYMCQQSLINYLDTELNKDAAVYQKIGDIQTDALGNKVKAGQLDLTAEHKPGPQIAKEDIETLIKYGEQVGENEIIAIKKQKDISEGKQKGTGTKSKLPQSIIDNALAIDNALKNIRICDPAVGSGAFPVGMMNEIVRARNALSPYLSVIARNKATKQSRTIYEFKRHAIQNCLYGVDIAPGAVEIAKLRLWLSLIVDEENIKRIKPLPNLDYKIVCGNSLLGVEKDLLNFDLYNNLEELKPLFFEETNARKKQEYRNQIDELISQITNGHKDFDFEVYFSEVFHKKKGFDVVIANPPYGFRNVLTAEEKRYFRKEEKIEFSSGDSAELFCKKCFDILLKKDGFLTFIIPKKSLYGDAWEGLRKEYWNKYCLTFLLDSSKAFEKVLLEQSIFGLNKNKQDKKIKVAYLDNNDKVVEFAETEKDKIFMEHYTAQIYKELYPEIFKKISKNKIKEILVKGDLGLAIGINFFSDKPTKYKLLKGIDIDKWRIKQNRYLKNEGELKVDELNKFSKPKVICQVLVAHIENPTPHIKITACYDADGIAITNTLTSFKIDERLDEKFWLAYLNSNFVSWYSYNFIYSRAIRTMHFYNFYIQQIPIPKKIIEQPEQQKPFVALVDKILAISKDDDYLENSIKQSEVKEYERQIDQMVYKLYGLTEEEIRIVEK